MLDFIEGVDVVTDCNVIDFSINKYGHLFIDFLLSCNTCILNGRNYVMNDFTCLKANGHSVVDYCSVNHDDLSIFTDFTVTNVIDIINSIGHDTGLTSAVFPNHSVLSWKLNFGNVE